LPSRESPVLLEGVEQKKEEKKKGSRRPPVDVLSCFDNQLLSITASSRGFEKAKEDERIRKK
jgi:hypothetical protein